MLTTGGTLPVGGRSPMAHARYRLIRPALPLAALLLTACESPRPDHPPQVGVPFDSLFVRETTVVLNDSEHPMVDLEEVVIGRDGRIAIADRRGHRVHVFDSTGGAQTGVGRRGDAPGEFETPLGAVWGDDGSLFVVDFGSPWVTRFRPDLSLDTALPLPDGRSAELHNLGSHLLVGVRGRGDGDGYMIIDTSGAVVRTLAPIPDDVTAVPYWQSLYDETAAVAAGGERIYVASSLFYPIRAFNAGGGAAGSLGRPPPSWRQARRPEVGEFVGQPLTALAEYLESFTVILSVHALADSVLVVSHGRYAPTEGAPFAQEPARADLYIVPDRKVATDVPLPGRVVGTHGDRLILRDETDPGIWSLSFWRARF